ncbi:reverse transcriptase domain-containing protein [Tanacetum coccineum]
MKHSYSNDDTCFSIDVIDEILEEDFDALLDESSEILHSIERTILEEKLFAEFDEFMAMTADGNSESESDIEEPSFKKSPLTPITRSKHLLKNLLLILNLNLFLITLNMHSWKNPLFSLCMLAIFHDMIAESVKVFMDDFRVFGSTFDHCMNNLDKMLQRCKDAHLVLNWEKCHFMIKEGIVLGHKVSEVGLEVDKAKIDVISKLSPPTNIKEFDIEIKDRKGIENVTADHLSWIENKETSDDSEVDDHFPRENLMEMNTEDEPWFADFANYLASDIIPKGMTYQQNNNFFSDIKHYLWEEPYLFKVCSDSMIRRIIHETTAPYTPQQNGVAERKNRALKEMVNSMLSYSGLSDGFWGEAMAIVRLSDPKRKTLGEKGIDCIFVGYVEHSKAYRFYVIEPNDFMSINTIIESRDAIFDENRFSSIPRPMDIIPNSDKSQRVVISIDLRDQEIILDLNTLTVIVYRRILEPIMKLCNLEMLLSGKKQLMMRFARITTIRLLLALAAIHNLVIHQMDVKTTFLNGNVEEEVYMKQPEGFVMACNEHKVCKLVKSLYGLKQAPKQFTIPVLTIRVTIMEDNDVFMPALTKEQRKEAHTPFQRLYAVLEIWNEYNILEDIKRGPYSKKLQYAISNPLDTPYRTDFQTL